MTSAADEVVGDACETDAASSRLGAGLTVVDDTRHQLASCDERTVSASDRPWNSATTLFIARQLSAIGNGRPLKVLDLGCGDGAALELLADVGHDVYGYELAYRGASLRRRLGHRLGAEFEDRVRIAPDERTIPFDDHSFDVVCANQVFEHVRFFDRIISECARVLRPGGSLVSLFPLATDPIEPHLRIPFAHWLPPGRFRRAYFWPFYALRLRRAATAKQRRRPCAAKMSHWPTACTIAS